MRAFHRGGREGGKEGGTEGGKERKREGGRVGELSQAEALKPEQACHV